MRLLRVPILPIGRFDRYIQAMKKLDLQDGLLLVGVATLCAGVGFIYWPASLIVFGVLSLAAVFLIARTQPDKDSTKD